jgi:hypothetical protein
MVTQKAQKGFYEVQIRPYIPLVKKKPEQERVQWPGIGDQGSGLNGSWFSFSAFQRRSIIA